jgi:drug/metabolite transporter (DMT)-like permease
VNTIPDVYIGLAAGLTTSLLWTFTSIFFTAASRRLGAAAVNALRIVIAVVLLGVTHRLIQGAWLPALRPLQMVYLAASGIVGLSLGDLALFSAFVHVGPRLAMLIMTTAPISAALFGWLALGEVLTATSVVGVALTIGGVAWVLLERVPESQRIVGANYRRGLLLALVASVCQAGGLLLSKSGIGHGWLPREQHLPPQTATYARMAFAALGVLPTVAWLVWRRRASSRAAALKPAGAGRTVAVAAGEITVPTTPPIPADPSAPTGDLPSAPLESPMDRARRRAGYFYTFCGAVVGPFLGVWMSLVASDRAPLGIAQASCSLPPVLILPFLAFFQHEHISRRAVVGALVAVGGIAVLFWR